MNDAKTLSNENIFSDLTVVFVFIFSDLTPFIIIHTNMDSFSQ